MEWSVSRRSLLFGLRFFFQPQRGGVDAITQTGWPRAVWEDVAQVCFATAAMDFCPSCHHFVVHRFTDVFFDNRLPKTWPASPRIVFCFAGEQRQPTTDTAISSVFFAVPIFAGTRALGCVFAGYSELNRRQQCLPFFIGFLNEVLVRIVGAQSMQPFNKHSPDLRHPFSIGSQIRVTHARS